MKSLIPLLLVLALAATACGSKKSAATTSTAASTTSTTGATAFKVGLNTDIGGLNDRGFNHLAYVGLLQAQRRLGVQTRVIQSASPADYIPNLSKLAEQGYNLVIGVGYTEIDALKAVAKQFPKTHFAIVDVSNADEGGLKNVAGPPLQGAGGRLPRGLRRRARRQAARRQGGLVSGRREAAPVDRYIAGFQAGAKAADPGVKTPNAYSQDFDNQAKCKEVALNQIAAGSVVVFQVAGGCGLGALDAAKEQNVWGVGVDADQGYLGTYVLTSALKRVDTAVYDSIRDAKAGKFKGGTDAVYGLDIGGVGIGKFSPKTPAGIAAKVAAIKQQIASGKITNIPTTVK